MTSRKVVNIIGIPVDYVTMDEAYKKVLGFLEGDVCRSVYTPNAEILMEAQTDAELMDILNKADLLVADGAGVVLASKLIKEPLPEKVSGIDLTTRLFRNSKENQIKYYFFGSKPGIAQIAKDKLLELYPDLKVVGIRDGYFKKEDEEGIIASINASGAQIVLVAHGAPRQEKWIAANMHKLNAKVCIGVGGSLDVFAGKVALAPETMRKAGFEWLFRLYKEPWRFKRMMRLPRFVIKVLFGV